MAHSSTYRAAPTPVSELTVKLYDADSDIRYMSLNDLSALFTDRGSIITQDLHSCNKIVDGFVNTLNDPNGEVQNLTIKCLGSFVLVNHRETVRPLLHKLTSLSTENAVDSSVSAMAVRAVVMAIPNYGFYRVPDERVRVIYDGISRILIPCLVGKTVLRHDGKGPTPTPKGLLQQDLEQGTDSNYIDVLIEVTKNFGHVLRKEERQALLGISMKVLESERAGSAMKKKALQSISHLGLFFSPEVLSDFLNKLIESLRQPHLTDVNRRLYLSLLGSIARTSKHMGPHIQAMSPFLFAALSQDELDVQMEDSDEGERDQHGDEVREAALATLETFLLDFPEDMIPFHDETLNSVIRFLKYDPNFSGDDEEADEEEDDFDLDEDFEQEAVGGDDDDVSWKVRRAAAKTLHSFIASKTDTVLGTPSIFETILKILVERFKEREESVRLQVLQTASFLIQSSQQRNAPEVSQPREVVDQSATSQGPLSRKRRRGESNVSMLESPKFGRFTGSVSPMSRSPPREGSAVYLGKMEPTITKELLALIKSSTPATKQAALVTLRDLVISQRGGLDEYLNEIFALLSDLIDPAGKNVDVASVGSGTGSAASVQIEALRLAADLAKTHSSSAIQPLMVKSISAVVSAARSRSPTVASEALGTIEQFVKVLTPPRIVNINQKTSTQLEQLLDVLVGVISVKTADLAIRQKAISVLGILLGRTCNSKGSELVSETKRQESLDLLYNMSKNETTRHTTINTINAMGRTATSDGKFDSSWLSKALLELGGQLRRSDRSLRGASLTTLRTFVSERGASSEIDDQTNKELISMLKPLLISGDLHLIGPCLIIFAAMARDSSVHVVDDDFIANLCSLVSSSTASMTMDQLCALIQAVGQRGNGKPLMQALLQKVGVGGSPPIVGKVIGELLVTGEGSVGVKIPDFLNELKTTQDDKRKVLALSVLGEVGLRSGPSSSLAPDLFTSYFTSKSEDVSLAAATALGRVAAGSGNIKSYAPVILSNLKGEGRSQYLVLHSVKELFQYGDNLNEMGPFMGPLWEASIAAAREERSRTIGAECVANLAIIEPKTYLSSLQDLLTDEGPSVRGTAIVSFRDVFTATDASYNQHLEPIIFEVLAAMLKDENIENRRSALNTFNAAFRGKFKLVLPHLPRLVPLILKHTYEDPALIREISMGPFKHKIDDGLEVRKVAYEILYSLLELTAATQIDIPAIYARIIAGLSDEHSIRALCNLMVLKMARGRAPPEETISRLEEIVDKYRAILKTQLKENAVRYEHEQHEESIKGAIRVSVELAMLFPLHRGNDAESVPGGVTVGRNAPGRAAGPVGLGEQGDYSGPRRVQNFKWAGYLSEIFKDRTQQCREASEEIKRRQDAGDGG